VSDIAECPTDQPTNCKWLKPLGLRRNVHIMMWVSARLRASSSGGVTRARACGCVRRVCVCVCVCVCRRVHDDDDDARHIIINQSINPSIMKTPTAGAAPVRGYWDASEEGALRRAVQKHGIGAWEKMRNDPEFTALRCVDDDDDDAMRRRRWDDDDDAGIQPPHLSIDDDDESSRSRGAVVRVMRNGMARIMRRRVCVCV